MPLIVAVAFGLLPEAVMPLVRVSLASTATVGPVCAPPSTFKVRPASVFVPNMVSVEAPLSTGALDALICPWPTVIVTVELFSVSPPDGTTTVLAALLSVRMVPSRTVPPE